jgi:hypothetical protein
VKPLRWLLVVPVGIAGTYLGALCAILLVSVLEWLCPVEDQVSGLCFASWYPPLQSAAIALGAAVGAACTVGLPALLAPTRKKLVSLVAYTGGTSYATWFLVSVGGSFLVPFSVAIATGLLVTIGVYRCGQNAT